MNAAGSLGFIPDARGLISLETLGVFVSNAITIRPRKGTQDAEQIYFPGGALLQSSSANAGLAASLRKYSDAWARAEVPIIIHLQMDEPQQASRAVQEIEELENILAIELGLPANASTQLARDLCQASMGELPLIASVPLEQALGLAPTTIEAGATAVSLAAPRGSLLNSKGRLVNGRLYGPGLFPMSLSVVQALSLTGIKVIGGGGVYSSANAQAMLNAGALAVQVDTVLWKADSDVSEWNLS